MLHRLAAAALACFVALCPALALEPGDPAGPSPERRYIGVGQPVMVAVEGLAALTLHRFDEPVPMDRAEVSGSEVDLLAVFETLRAEGGPPRALLVQGWDADGPVGQPVVVQPMRSPERVQRIDPATLSPTNDPSRGVPMFESERRRRLAERGVTPPPAEARTFSGFRVYALADVVFSTTLGEIRFRLRPDQAPNTCYRIMDLVEGGLYTALPFHRIVTDATTRFVAQTGDPTGTGLGGSGEWFDLEPSGLRHGYGVLSIARWDDPDAGGSQVFVCLGDDGLGVLDGRYTAFAEAISGVGTIEALARIKTDADDRPLDPPMLISARLAPAVPATVQTLPVGPPARIDAPRGR